MSSFCEPPRVIALPCGLSAFSRKASTLPSGNNERIKKLQEYRPYPMTLVFYEAPHRIEKMLQNCLDVLGDRTCCIAREITKLHEEFIRGKISEILEEGSNLKGEIVVVMEGNHDDYEKDVDMSHILRLVHESMEAGLSTKDAIKEVAEKTGISKNSIYDLVHHENDVKGRC